jgi:DNA mismatch endonuclease (patch repair protein)
MTDIVDKETRSRMMARIKSKNTGPEKRLRSALHRIGLRFRLHGKLPGKPDIVLNQFKAVIFVNGCFWHGHNCKLFKWPLTRPEFWQNKIKMNVVRDSRNKQQLKISGWRTLTVWECAMKGNYKKKDDEIAQEILEWLTNKSTNMSIRGKNYVGR